VIAVALNGRGEQASRSPGSETPSAGTPAVAVKDGEVVRMIEAHGGMAAWKAAPTVAFTDRWEGGPATRIVVEQSRRRAYLTIPDSKARAAWDGKRAWSENWDVPMPPRFAALLNFYFLNLPWLTQDPGVILQETAPARVLDDPTEYRTVRMTFAPGVGDTPRDYYVLYIHPETFRLHGCEYIVTYRGILPEGVESSPPHDLVFETFETVGGLLVPTAITIYEKDGSVYAAGAVSDWSFSEPFDEDRMIVQAGSVMDKTRP
jgi:hypothetical protein